VLVHPPGGLVGGDTLDIGITAGAGSHGLVTTPGASRFYRSEGELALQRTRIALAPEARLEWLPLEAICYSGCRAENRITIDARPGAELIGWDLTALGLPNASQPFARGLVDQHALRESAGATSPHAEVVVLRVLAPVVEPAMQLLRQVWLAWRAESWALRSAPPRIWSM
ncbi:MAG: urease accessory protein UreD, partial [Comamonadaceae bacterium]